MPKSFSKKEYNDLPDNTVQIIRSYVEKPHERAGEIPPHAEDSGAVSEQFQRGKKSKLRILYLAKLSLMYQKQDTDILKCARPEKCLCAILEETIIKYPFPWEIN